MPKQSLAKRQENLSAIPLFSGLSKASLERIARMVTELEAPAGFVLVRPNTEAAGLFCVQEGTVAVELRGGAKVKLGPGEFFGELALINPGPARTARVRAETDVVCLALRRDDFLGLLESEPKVAIAMLKVLAQRLQGAGAKAGKEAARS